MPPRSASWLELLLPARIRAGRRTRVLGMASAAVLLGIGFDVAYGQSPLYSGNQVHHLLYGLADSGRGYLERDWLAQTADPAPVFTFVVAIVAGSLHENLFYLLHAVLLGTYLYSAVGIATQLFRLDTAPRLLTFILGFAAVHAPLAAGPLDSARAFLTEGVARQYVLGGLFQPSVFGVFLVLSLYLFLRERPVWSAAAAAAAGTFHPTYLIAGGLMTAGYALAAARQANVRRAVLVCATFGVLVLPIVIATLLEFRPAAEPLHSRAQEILVHVAVPHHALPSEWFRANDLLQLGLVVGALLAIRRSPLFPVLSVMLTGALALTALQLVTGSDTLALLFPWRPSVVLVPIATTILLGALVTRGFDRFPVWETSRGRELALSAVVLLVVIAGVRARDVQRGFDRHSPADAMMEFVDDTKRPSDTFLVPVASGQEDDEPLLQFRIATGAPIFVDFKARAYKDAEVLEWYRRLHLARAVYRKGEPDCTRVKSLAGTVSLTRVIVTGSSFRGCSELALEYRDRSYSVFSLRRSLRQKAANVGRASSNASTGVYTRRRARLRSQRDHVSSPARL